MDKDIEKPNFRFMAEYCLKSLPVEISAMMIEETMMKHDNGKPKYSVSGMLLTDEGKRSIFDDVDE